MKRAMTLALVLTACLAAGAVAAPTDWWSQAIQSEQMMNKDKAQTWLANKDDNMTKIVRTLYGIPADKSKTINQVIDAVMRYNNAMAGRADLYNAEKVTPITDRNLILEGKVYFIPDPLSIDKILKGQDPAAVVTESMTVPANVQQAQGAGEMPLHARGDLNVQGDDSEGSGDTAGASGARTGGAQALGDRGTSGGTDGTGTVDPATAETERRQGRVRLLNITSDIAFESGPTEPASPASEAGRGTPAAFWGRSYNDMITTYRRAMSPQEAAIAAGTSTDI